MKLYTVQRYATYIEYCSIVANSEEEARLIAETESGAGFDDEDGKGWIDDIFDLSSVAPGDKFEIISIECEDEEE